jgi:hypothetical protein
MSENMRIYGKRYCATCEHLKSLDNGKVVDRNSNRWVCFDCKPEKKNVSQRKNAKSRKAPTVPTLRDK